ncbi:HAMP domain-containing protein [Vibrio makurazakiensis]|uniref:LapD/MoxY N-terminal periplasmic domain-containing protein n=1 Tax=Vibrio makurazakiensis TaxID=2910250 RepID=UPI003D0F878D
MTLHRQLFIILTVILTSLSVLTISVAFKATQRHLTEQQYVELNNTAHAIGFALKPAVANKSVSHINLVLTSFFDSGHYQSVTLTFKDDRPTIHHEYEESNIPVPSWFRNYFTLQPVVRSVSVSSGWTAEGTLTIQGSSMFSYIRLWNTTLAFVLLGGFFNILALVIFHLVLKRTLQPLNALTQHVADFQTNHTYTPLTPPKTKEVATLISAFNSMSRQLDSFIGDLESSTAKLCQSAYLDDKAGVPNRVYIIESLARGIKEKTNGSMAVFQSPKLKELKDDLQFEELNNRIKKAVSLLSQNELAGLVVAKLSDSELVLLDTDGEDGGFFENSQRAYELLSLKFDGGVKRSSVSISQYSSVKTLLTDMDNQLKATIL